MPFQISFSVPENKLIAIVEDSRKRKLFFIGMHQFEVKVEKNTMGVVTDFVAKSQALQFNEYLKLERLLKKNGIVKPVVRTV